MVVGIEKFREFFADHTQHYAIRLAELLKPDESFDLAETIRNDLARFIDEIEADTSLDLSKFNLTLSKDETIALLRSVYRLPPPI